MPQKKNRIGNLTAILMTTIALIFDVLQAISNLAVFIPFVGLIIAVVVSWFITILASIFFFAWYSVQGITLFERHGFRIILLLLSTFIIEIIPFLNIIPAWTAGTIITILLVRHSDKRYNEEKEKTLKLQRKIMSSLQAAS